MTSVSRSPRISRIHLLAAGLMGIGLFALGLPWLVSSLAEPTVTPMPLAAMPVKRANKPQVPLPSKNLQGREALKCGLDLLKAGLTQIRQTENFAGTFRKQERIDGILDDGSLIQVISRHEPLSFYMKWLKGDKGRELLFVEGENEGEMLVRLGGIRGRLLPVFKIDPDGETAREKTRHHISHMSLINFTQTVVDHCERDLKRTSGVECELLVDGSGEEARWIRVCAEYGSPEVGGEYRKAIYWIDRETLLPLKIKTYGWPEEGESISTEELDGETLLEDYEYSDVQFNLQLTDAVFREDNPNYSFVKRR